MAATAGYAQYNPEISRLAWSEEFNGKGHVNPECWNYEEGFVRNKELQYYTRRDKRNVRMEGGCLLIEAVKYDKGKKVAREGAEHLSPVLYKRYKYSPEKQIYTSGSINTLGKVSFFYGRIEVRAKIPTGRGAWPAIWMMGDDILTQGHPQCGEIDIMEHVGFEPLRFYATVHTPGSKADQDKVKRFSFIDLPDASSDFHVFALEWYEDRLDFFVDEKKYFTYSKQDDLPDHWRFDKPQFLLLNLAYGGGWGGAKGTDDSILPLTYQVDWVRYYQFAGTEK